MDKYIYFIVLIYINTMSEQGSEDGEFILKDQKDVKEIDFVNYYVVKIAVQR